MALKKVSAEGTQFKIISAGERTIYWNKPWVKIDTVDSLSITLIEMSEGERTTILFSEFYEGDGTTPHATEAAIITYLGSTLQIGK